MQIYAYLFNAQMFFSFFDCKMPLVAFQNAAFHQVKCGLSGDERPHFCNTLIIKLLHSVWKAVLPYAVRMPSDVVRLLSVRVNTARCAV